jgi:two-component system KDP operon response regulator KdpE
MHILLVEDDSNYRNSIRRKLEAAEHSVTVFDNSVDAMNYLDSHEPEVVLTDYRLGSNTPDGLMFAEHIRHRYPHCVIILMSAYAGEDELVKAIQIGADDFIKKPIGNQDLMERIYRAYTHRREWLPHKQKRVEEIPHLKIDTVKRSAEWRGQFLRLTPAEFQILVLLASDPGAVFSFNVLGTAISKGRMASSEDARVNLKTHVKNLRRKLARAGAPAAICSARGEGYKWDNNQYTEVEG